MIFQPSANLATLVFRGLNQKSTIKNHACFFCCINIHLPNLNDNSIETPLPPFPKFKFHETWLLAWNCFFHRLGFLLGCASLGDCGFFRCGFRDLTGRGLVVKAQAGAVLIARFSRTFLHLLRWAGRFWIYVSQVLPSDLFGCFKRPFQGLSDLHLGYEQVTWKKLVLVFLKCLVGEFGGFFFW